MFNRRVCVVALIAPILFLVTATSEAEEGRGNREANQNQKPYVIKIFQLVNIEANEAWNILGGVFQREQERQALTIAIDPRRNALIAKGEEATLAEAEALLLKIDEKPEKERYPTKTLTLRLKQIAPTAMEKAIRTQAHGAYTILSDDRTGSLIMTAPADVLEKVQTLVELLDAPPVVRGAGDAEDTSIRMVWLVGQEIAAKDSPPVPSDLAPVIEALRKKTGIGELRTASQMIVHNSPENSGGFTVLGTADLPVPYRVNFQGEVRRTSADRYWMQINANARTIVQDQTICEVNTQFRSLVPGRPVVLGTSTVDSHPSVFVIQIMENNEK